jgi:hypothetical protein
VAVAVAAAELSVSHLKTIFSQHPSRYLFPVALEHLELERE